MYTYLDVTLLYSFNLCKTCLPLVVVACNRYLQLLDNGKLCLETVHDDEAKVEWILARWNRARVRCKFQRTAEHGGRTERTWYLTWRPLIPVCWRSGTHKAGMLLQRDWDNSDGNESTERWKSPKKKKKMSFWVAKKSQLSLLERW